MEFCASAPAAWQSSIEEKLGARYDTVEDLRILRVVYCDVLLQGCEVFPRTRNTSKYYRTNPGLT